MKTDKKSNLDMTLESRLGLLSFDLDDDFITVDTDLCKSCEKKPCLYVCPSKVYDLSDGGHQIVRSYGGKTFQVLITLFQFRQLNIHVGMHSNLLLMGIF